MKHPILLGVLTRGLAGMLSMITPAMAASATPDAATTEQVVSYAFGYKCGREANSSGIRSTDIDQERFIKGFFTGFANDPPEGDAANREAERQAFSKMFDDRKKGNPTPPLAAATKKVGSYIVGCNSGNQLGQVWGERGMTVADIDREQVMRGYVIGLARGDSEIADDKINAAGDAWKAILAQREKESVVRNLEAGKTFLNRNGRRREVISTQCGLQYEVLRKGEGRIFANSKPDDFATAKFFVHYRITLIDGTEVGASPAGQAEPFPDGISKGAEAILRVMPVGSKWRLFIPADLAFGEQRHDRKIGPNSTLICELDLVNIRDNR